MQPQLPYGANGGHARADGGIESFGSGAILCLQ